MDSISARLLEELGDPDGWTIVEDLPHVRRVRVPRETILRARADDGPVAVARLHSGQLVVLDDRCPHDGGRISDGWVEGERIVCARHGWELEVENGRCVRATNCKPRE